MGGPLLSGGRESPVNNTKAKTRRRTCLSAGCNRTLCAGPKWKVNLPGENGGTEQGRHGAGAGLAAALSSHSQEVVTGCVMQSQWMLQAGTLQKGDLRDSASGHLQCFGSRHEHRARWHLRPQRGRHGRRMIGSRPAPGPGAANGAMLVLQC